MSAAVVGLGSRDRGDDAVGLVVADRLAEQGITVVPAAAPLDLLDLFQAHDTVVVVDAMRSGAQPGTVTVTSDALAVRAAASTHGLGLADAVELARVLDRLPARLVLVGVELEAVAREGALSDRVAGAVDAAAAAVLRALAATECP